MKHEIIVNNAEIKSNHRAQNKMILHCTSITLNVFEYKSKGHAGNKAHRTMFLSDGDVTWKSKHTQT